MGNSCLLLERRFYQTVKDIHSEIRRKFHILRCSLFGRLRSSEPLFHSFPMRSESTLHNIRAQSCQRHDQLEARNLCQHGNYT
jgi:hypothetical protein